MNYFKWKKNNIKFYLRSFFFKKQKQKPNKERWEDETWNKDLSIKQN